MALSNEEIAKKIDDGIYFKESLYWYCRKYIFTITERSIILIMAIASGIAFFITLVNFNSVVSDVERIPIHNFVENSTDFFSHIKPLAKENETTQEAVSNYLIKDYIKTLILIKFIVCRISF